MNTISQLFMEGGPLWMSLITIMLVALFFAAWKAPAWVKEVGIAALVIGLFSLLLGLDQMFAWLRDMPVDEHTSIMMYGGLKCAIVPLLYGLIVYFVSLVLRVIQKPRI